MQLSPGLQVGPYQVLSVLGAGGMAEVYRARDTRLGRDVALKVVNAALAGDPELVHRFEQEARVAGSLKHPNVLAVYDVGQHEGVPYFVTELLEGESLRSRLARGRVPLQTALEWGAQLARGLAAAHARGVIHRDVKPDNIFVGSDGQVKLLDFGIAKLAEAAEAAGPRGMMDATVTPSGGATRTGAVLGTPGYMSPEQVRGEPLDARSDLFSLGVVLHELLSGTRAFPGSFVESGYAILHNDPAPLPSELPAPVAQVVLRCLEKEPARRFQSASDLAFALEVLRGATWSGAEQRLEPRRPGRRWLPLAVLGALLVGAALVGVLRRGATSAAPATALPSIEQVTFRWGAVRAARFAADGRVFFSATFEGHPEEIFTRPVGSAISQPLGLSRARLLAVSPSGELAVQLEPHFSLMYTARGTLARVPGVGGTPREVAENVEYADWSPRGELAVIAVHGATRAVEFPPGKVLFETPGWASDVRFSHRGDRLAFIHHPVFGDSMGELMVMEFQGKPRALTRRLPSIQGLAWAPADDEIWFSTGQLQRNLVRAVDAQGNTRDLYRVPSDLHLDDVAPDGSVLVTNQFERAELESVDSSGKHVLLSWTEWVNSSAAVSPDRKVLFSVASPVLTETGMQPALAVLRSVDGSPAQVLGEGEALDLSADGRWALVRDLAGESLEALPTGPGQPRRYSLGGLKVRTARWLPDGKRLVLVLRTTGGPFQLFELDPDRGPPRQISNLRLSGRSTFTVSPDGRLAATLDERDDPIVISLADGTAVRTAGLGRDWPRGWAAPREIWITRGADFPTAQQLLRVDIDSGKVLEQRTVGPADPTGSSSVTSMQVSGSGRDVAFTFNRFLGHLYIVRGLPRRGP